YQINSNIYNTNLINNLDPGEYNIIVSDFNNCKSDTTVIISEPAPLKVSVVVSNPTCIGNNNGLIELGVIGGEYPYNYIVNGIKYESPIIANLSHGSYFITVLDNNSCEYRLTNIILSDYQEDCIRIPNAFTPNDDGINDLWVIENIELFPDAIVQVFNRWGQLLFETKDPGVSWDGKLNNSLLPTGTYIYIIAINNNDKTYTGTVTIVR
ncbi:MAG: gliding motility-associated C-terminal domain-containing protein, partial [Bacteroidales bacterium]